MEWVSLFVYILIIFYNGFFSKYIPYSNYIDEFICLLFMAVGIVRLFRSKGKIIINKQQRNCWLCVMLLLLSGIIGNIIYVYMPSFSVITRDVIGTFKFFIIYLIGIRIILKKNIHVNSKKMITITKIIVTIIFFFAIINLLVDVGMGSDMRYGFRCYSFIYTHYTYLVYNEVILYSILATEDKKNTVFKIMSLISIIATLRTKGFIAVAFVLIYFLFNFAKKKNLSFKDIFKPTYIIPIGVLTYFISKNKILEYLSWGSDNSIRIGMHNIGFRIASEHFPFGTGFGTYGTNISYKYHSYLYDIYNSLNYSHLLNYGYAVISDVYWPSIYVQFGYVGLFIFVFLLFQICKDLLKNIICDNKCKFSVLLIMFYMVSASITEATFSNESGAFSAVILLMIVLISKNKIGSQAN